MRDDDVEELALRMADFVRRDAGARSRWALRTALDALDTEGISGALTFQIPAREKDRPEISFVVGNVDIITRWGA